jgi:hypothetical protein
LIAALAAQEDRDFDLVVPEVLHRGDLRPHEQARPEQAERDRNRDDDGKGHREVAAQAAAHLTGDECGAHYWAYP